MERLSLIMSNPEPVDQSNPPPRHTASFVVFDPTVTHHFEWLRRLEFDQWDRPVIVQHGTRKVAND